MRKAFYFTFALICLLAFGLASCDMDLTPQTQSKPSNSNPTGSTGQDKLLEVKATVDGKPLVLSITQSKPSVSKSAAKSISSGSYYYQITLGGTTISWGTTIVAASSGNIVFSPDDKSPGGKLPFQGTLTASNEVKIPTIPVQGKAITDVTAGANGGTGKATFDTANLADVLDPKPVTQPETKPENPVTKDDPKPDQRTLTIKGFPQDASGKYVRFYAQYEKDEGNLVYVMGSDSDFPAEITNGNVTLKLYSLPNREWVPYTGSETLTNLGIEIYRASDRYSDAGRAYPRSADAKVDGAALDVSNWEFEIQRTLTIKDILDVYEGKYMYLSAYNGVDEIVGYSDPIEEGKVTLNIYSQKSDEWMYTRNGKFEAGNIVLFILDDDEYPIASLRPTKDITFTKADLELSAKDWGTKTVKVVSDLELKIIEPFKKEYKEDEMLDLANLKVKVIIPDNIANEYFSYFDGKTYLELDGTDEKLSFSVKYQNFWGYNYEYSIYPYRDTSLYAGNPTVSIQFIDISHDDLLLHGETSFKITVKESDDDGDTGDTGPTSATSPPEQP